MSTEQIELTQFSNHIGEEGGIPLPVLMQDPERYLEKIFTVTASAISCTDIGIDRSGYGIYGDEWPVFRFALGDEELLVALNTGKISGVEFLKNGQIRVKGVWRRNRISNSEEEYLYYLKVKR